MKKPHRFALFLTIVVALSSLVVVHAQATTGETTFITLGSTIAVEGGGVAVDGSTVTVQTAGTFNFSGTLADGVIIVDTADSGLVRLILNGVELHSSNGAPIHVHRAAAAALVLADGTENHISDADRDDDDDDTDPSAIFSAPPLTVEGAGSLTVTAANQGIRVRESLALEGGNLTINAGDDAVHSEGDFVMHAGAVVISAREKGIHSTYNLEINGGSVSVLDSDEGFEGGFITINDGSVDIVARDDGINVSIPDDDTGAANPYFLRINGGFVAVNAGGDGLDSNGSIEMTGGVVLVNGPTGDGDGALDYDLTFNISGGLLVAAGSAGMPQAPSASSAQNSVLINLKAAQPAGTLFHVQTSSGAEILTFAPAKRYQSVVFSLPELVSGESYAIYTGGSSTGAESFGLYQGGAYTPGALESSFTVEDTVTLLGNVMRRRR